MLRMLLVLGCMLGMGLGVQQALAQCQQHPGNGNQGFCRVTGSCGMASQCIKHSCSAAIGCIGCQPTNGTGCFFFGCNCNTLCPDNCCL